jgi:hypothetical protein
MSSPFTRIFLLISSLALAVPAPSQTSPAPALTINSTSNQIVLTWPTNNGGFTLESANSLENPVSWLPRTNGLSISGSNILFSISPLAAASFYRLHGLNPNDAITAPPLTWTWVDFNDCFCMEGTTTGIGINLNTNSTGLLIFLLGGGACWDYNTCYVLSTAVHGPFGEVEFDGLAPLLDQAWFLDRSSTNNPFRDFSYVFVPYCTGDLFAGSQVDLYQTNITMQVGFVNMQNYLKRLVPTFPGVKRVVLAGSSAGGFGAIFNWQQTRQAFGGNVRVDVIDDSGPILTPDVLAEGLPLFSPGSEPVTNWNFTAALPLECASCESNVSSLYGFIATSAPTGRLALLSYTQDETIRSYFGLSAVQFASGLDELAAAEFSPYTNLAYFFVPGQDHVLALTPSLNVNGVTLQQFLTQMINDDPAWTSQHP